MCSIHVFTLALLYWSFQYTHINITISFNVKKIRQIRYKLLGVNSQRHRTR